MRNFRYRSSARQEAMARNRRELSQRPYPRSGVESHIQVQRAAEEDPEGQEAHDEWHEPFVQKESLQYNIEESIPSSSSVPPTTFAEATMAARHRAHVGRGSTVHEGGSFDAIAGPLSAEALGPFRHILKKKKKASKLSLFETWATDTEDAASELGSHVEANSRLDFDRLNSRVPIPEDDKHFSSIKDSTSGKETEKVLASREEAVLNSAQPPANSTQFYIDPIDEGELAPDKGTLERTLSHHCASARFPISTGSDSESMGNSNALDDGFDTLEWDPDLVAATRDNSPEPITVKPPRVAYTTVGSLVNPDVVPQFTAPNRIQREASGRRLQSNEGSGRRIQSNRDQQGSHYHSRGPPPPLSAANSMQYTQHILGNANYIENIAPRSSGFLNSVNQEQEGLQRLQDLSLPRVRAGNVQQSDLNRSPSDSSSASVQQFSFKRGIEGEEDQSAKRYKDIAGLEKMQTLQRMAKYDNPFQQIARDRLSEFVAPLKPQTIPVTNNSSSPAEDATKGELDRSFRFPPPGLNALANFNPLMNTLQGQSRFSQSEQSLTRPPGYPQPLTAGPPGQRSMNTAIRSTHKQFEIAQSPWSPSAYERSFIRLPDSMPLSSNISSACHSERRTALLSSGYRGGNHEPTWKTVDTLPVSAILRYYPESLAPDIDGRYRTLAANVQQEMDLVSAQTWNKDVNKAIRVQNLENWFYHGQRKSMMTIDDHILELEDMHRFELEKHEPANTFGLIRLAKNDPPPLECALYTIEEMNRMRTAEAAAKLVNGAFGTLLAYADNRSTSRSKKSGFVKSPAWQIDSSENGNVSFFGEDWGPPPKRFGRDPRYQSTFHKPSSTHWE